MKRSIGLLLAVVVLLSGCGHAANGAATSALSTPASPSSPALSPPIPPAGTTPKIVAPPAMAAVPNPANLSGDVTVSPSGAVLPNHARTPGAVNPSVSQANIRRTICVKGWTATVRPPASYTTRLKEKQLASGYTYKGDRAKGDYEEDHLISLELGGAPSAEVNLWPEPYKAPEGAKVKDVVENTLHSLVCNGAITLAAAQRAIASNWWVAYQTEVGHAPK